METFFYFFVFPAGLIVSSVVFLYLGKRSRKRRHQESEASKATSEAVFKKITTCERCGRRNYRITRNYISWQYKTPPYPTRGFDYESSSEDTIFRITCKDCGHIMYEDTFYGKNDHVNFGVESVSESGFKPITDEEFPGIGGESFSSSSSCSEWLYFGLGYSSLGIFILRIIAYFIVMNS